MPDVGQSLVQLIPVGWKPVMREPLREGVAESSPERERLKLHAADVGVTEDISARNTVTTTKNSHGRISLPFRFCVSVNPLSLATLREPVRQGRQSLAPDVSRG